MKSAEKINHAIIMAAGRGTRMLPLTNVIPKPMAPFDGSTLIARGIEQIRQHLPYIHITVGYKGELLAEHVIKMQVSSVFNTDGKGNAWWIYNTLLRYLNEPIFVLTSDNVVEIDFGALAADYFSVGAPALMVVPVRPVEGLEGDFIFQTNQVVEEITRTKTNDLYCSGIQILNPAKVNALTQPTESFYDVWQSLIAQKQVYMSNVLPQKWVAIDTLEQLNRFSRGIDSTAHGR